MKTRAYLRVAKGPRKNRVEASATPRLAPLHDASGNPLPTVAFAVDLDIPDALFEQAKHVIAEIKIPEEAAQIAAEVKQ